jgi:hypothetical protein
MHSRASAIHENTPRIALRNTPLGYPAESKGAPSMDSTRLVQSTGSSGAAVRAALKPTPEIHRTPSPVRANSQAAQTAPPAKPLGYGLPCAKCKTYYLASLNACPICKSTERVSPIALIPTRDSVPTQPANRDALSAERESFLRECKSKLQATGSEITSAPQRCTFAGEDEAVHKPAEVCKTCYEDLQERVDLFEAALHIDLNEAAQVIYDAVWADTTDSNRTYINAARALLAELRKRAGLKLVLGSMQPLTH